MPTYFKPLRRKIGVATLLMACVLLGVWLRSMTIVDVLKIPSAEGFRFSFTSEHERISWHKLTGPESERATKRVVQWERLSGDIDRTLELTQRTRATTSFFISNTIGNGICVAFILPKAMGS